MGSLHWWEVGSIGEEMGWESVAMTQVSTIGPGRSYKS